MDVYLLADVFENFRKQAHASYGLDPAMYLTMPSFSWDACLKLTDVHLELIQDPGIHLFFENNIRGGISVISHRYARANVPGTPDYNPEEPNSYILYVDANNLYGWAMSRRLPIGQFVFLSEDEKAAFVVFKISDDSRTGYVLECDLEYPAELHELHNDYPLAPQSLTITEDMLSSYCQSFGKKHFDCRKLVPNLLSKSKYVVHYQNLKFYLSHGLKLTKIHRILSFSQEEWMAPFVAFNTEKRQQAKTVVEQNMYKQSVNSTFGKTCENVRNRRNIHLVCDPLGSKS